MILTALALLSTTCGIDRVTPVRGGVAISFTYSGEADIRRDGQNRRVRIGRRPVRLHADEELMIRGVHDFCSLTIRTRDGVLGVEAYSWLSDPTSEHPASEETSFVPAQRPR
ncbi:MAG: hypothetical protein ACAH11_04340 [Sphingomonas sp.]